MTRSIVLFVALAGCTARELPPPTVPEQVLSAKPTELGDPPAGQGTLVLETGEPAVVEEVIGTTTSVATNGQSTAVGFGVSTALVCTTPCTTHVAQGQHQLVLTRVADGEWAGTGRVDVGVHPVAYRYAMGHAKMHALPRYGGLILAGVGLTGLMLGGISVATGDGLFDGPTNMIGSAVLTGVGALLVYVFRPEVQNGAGVQWELPAQTARD